MATSAKLRSHQGFTESISRSFLDCAPAWKMRLWAQHNKCMSKNILDTIDSLKAITVQREALLVALTVLLKMAEDGDYTTVELNQARAAIALCEKGE